jgi:hypothetical protein
MLIKVVCVLNLPEIIITRVKMFLGNSLATCCTASRGHFVDGTSDLRGSSFSSYRLNGAQLLDVTMQWSSFLALVLMTLSASVVLTSAGM